MRNSRMLVAALAALMAFGATSVWAQARHPEEGDDGRRLYPRYANPDGSLNCAPSCGLVGPCC